MPRRSRSFSRLFICLPLIAVLGIWVFSYGRYDSREFDIGQSRYLIASTDGHVQIWRDEIAYPGPGARLGKYQHVNVPYLGDMVGNRGGNAPHPHENPPAQSIPGR